MNKWDERFLFLAQHVSDWSKDPSTQVGCVLVRPDHTVASMGFNGFPRGVKDDERLHNRAKKYEIVVHAEINALLFARERLEGYTAYVYPLFPCSRCAVQLIQAGVKRVVAYAVNEEKMERWKETCALSEQLFREAGVETMFVWDDGRGLLEVDVFNIEAGADG